MDSRKDVPEGITRKSFLAKGSAFAFAAAVTGPGLTLLSGCGGGGSSSGPLTFMQFYGPDGEVAVQSKWFEDVVAAWNEENEQQVELQYVPPPEYISGTRLQTAFSSGEGPDIFLISPGDFLRYYNGGVLQDISQYMDQSNIDDFYPDVMTTRVVDGTFYALPMEVEPLAIYYSTQVFEDAGLSESDVPGTWDEFIDLGRRLQTDDRFGLVFEPGPGYYQNFTWYPFMWQGGGDTVTDDGQSSDFDSEATIQALAFWQETIQSGVAPRRVLGTGGGDSVANLAGGYTAMQNTGIWAVSELRENAPDFEYGVFPLPVPDGGEYTTALGGWSFVANSEGRNPEAAGRFCAFALGSDTKWMADWCFEAKSDLAPRKSVQEEGDERGAFDSGAMQVFRNQIFEGGRAEPRYPPEIYRAVSDAIQACQLDGADPEAQARQASDSINSFLEGYSGGRIA